MKKMIIMLLMFIGFTSNAQLPCWNTYTSNASNPNSPSGIAYGDFNGDGNSDIAVSTGTLNTVGIFLGNTSGTFSVSPNFTINTNGNNAAKIVAGNFNTNEDAILDLVVANASSGQISFLKGVGTGSFLTGVNYTISAFSMIRDISASDLNNDSKLDIVATGNTSAAYILYGSGTASTSTTFSNTTVLAGNGFGANGSISTGTLNSDSYPDFVLTAPSSVSITIFLNSGPPSYTFSGINYSVSGTGSARADSYLADIDNDNDLDIVAPGAIASNIRVFLNNGSGAVSTASTFASGLYRGMVCADFNKDGNIDLAGVTGTGNTFETMLGNGTGSFSPATALGSASNLVDIITTDFDLNTNPDVAFIGYGSGSGLLFVRLNGFSLNSNSSWSVCSGNSAILTATGAASYIWNPNNVFNGVSFIPNSTTTYTVIGTSVSGCTSSVVKTLTVNATPTITVVGTNPICYGDTSNFSVSGASTYSWSIGTTSSIVALSPTTTTNYTVFGTSINNCSSATTTIVLTVNPLPTVSVNNSSLLCSGVPFTLTASGASNYTWSGSSNTVANSIVTATNSSVSYTLFGASNSGCTNSTVATVSVNPLPIVLINSSSNTICAGSTVTLSVSGASSYVWDNTSTLTSIFVSPNTTTAYSVVGVDGNGCSNSASHSVVVNSNPTVSIVGSNIICLGESSTLTVNGADTYTWSNGSNFTNIVITPTSNITYSVIGVDNNNCHNSAAITVSVSECVGVAQNAKQNVILSVYPNPNNGEFTIQSENDLTVKVVNQLGQVVYSDVLNTENNKKTNISNLPVGLYYVVCSDGQSSVSKAVIVK